jgi:hypothetical protein
VLRVNGRGEEYFLDARTYGGAVELYANSGSARTVTAPTGTFVFSGALSSTEAGAGSVSVDLNTNDPTVTITGATTIGANTTLSASNSGALNINGNYTNNGTFTDNGGTVTLAGAAQQTLAGTMTGSSDFNNLTVTNVSGSDPDSSPSVIFSTGFTTAGTFTATTANTKLRFAAGATYTPAAINLNGQATGTRVFLRSSTPGTSFTFSAGAGARTVSNTVIKDSNACGSTGGSIDADDGTNRDDGNTSCWLINKLIASLSANALDLQGLSSTVVNQAGITNTVTTNAANGYVSLVKYNQTLTSGSNTISDTNGSIAAGENEFGVSSSQAGNTISQWSPTSCSNTGTTSTATALSSSFKSFASSASAVSGQVTTLCTLASTTALQQPGIYRSTITIVTTGKF